MSVRHASAVCLPQGTVLLTGPSGSGKSSLAALLLEHDKGRLVADDRVSLIAEGGRLMAEAPDTLRGLIELRGLGIVSVPQARRADRAAIDLVVDLAPRPDVARMAAPRHMTFEGVRLPGLRLHAFDMNTPSTIKAALAHLPTAGFAADGVYRENSDGEGFF